jgi:hypothetical protein
MKKGKNSDVSVDKTETRAKTTIASVIAGGDIYCWIDFRNEILGDKKLIGLWADNDFRWGFQMLCYSIDDIISAEDNDGILKGCDKVADLFMTDVAGFKDDSNHRSIQKLLDVLETVDVMECVYHAMKFDLTTIDHCILMTINSVTERKAA